LKHLSETLGIASKVRFTGYVRQDDIPKILTEIDVLILPSFSENFPIIMLESMASGVLFIGSRVGAIREIVQHGINGLLIKPGDVEDLKKTLYLVLTDSELRKRIVENAKRFVENFTIENVLRLYKELFESTVDD
jgi:glycosyltransferase involved in cell wall biosynthesis